MKQKKVKRKLQDRKLSKWQSNKNTARREGEKGKQKKKKRKM